MLKLYYNLKIVNYQETLIIWQKIYGICLMSKKN